MCCSHLQGLPTDAGFIHHVTADQVSAVTEVLCMMVLLENQMELGEQIHLLPR